MNEPVKIAKHRGCTTHGSCVCFWRIHYSSGHCLRGGLYGVGNTYTLYTVQYNCLQLPSSKISAYFHWLDLFQRLNDNGANRVYGMNESLVEDSALNAKNGSLNDSKINDTSNNYEMSLNFSRCSSFEHFE